MLRDVAIIEYKDLMTIDDIESLFEKSDNVVLYLNQDSDLGHWVTLHRSQDGIQYFDSYGRKPDSFRFTPKLRRMGITYPHLTFLLYQSGLPISWYPYRMQGPKTVTCGRWALLSLLFNNLSDRDFRRLFKGSSDFSADQIATALTPLK